jgi:arsenate reductase-like glutaredoxin family protein
MNDPEFRKLAKKFFITTTVILVFMVLIGIILYNKILIKDGSILKDIKNEKSMVIYVTENNCSNCKIIEKYLKKNNVDYKVLNKITDKDYEEIMNKIGVSRYDLSTPAVIYVKKGKLKAYIINTNKDEVSKFIENYKLSK